jgi:hypothetical protein
MASRKASVRNYNQGADTLSRSNHRVEIQAMFHSPYHCWVCQGTRMVGTERNGKGVYTKRIECPNCTRKVEG